VGINHIIGPRVGWSRSTDLRCNELPKIPGSRSCFAPVQEFVWDGNKRRRKIRRLHSWLRSWGYLSIVVLSEGYRVAKSQWCCLWTSCNCRIVWVRRDVHRPSGSTLLQQTGTPTAQSGCSETNPVWPWMFSGMEHLPPFWATCASVSGRSCPGSWSVGPHVSFSPASFRNKVEGRKVLGKITDDFRQGELEEMRMEDAESAVCSCSDTNKFRRCISVVCTGSFLLLLCGWNPTHKQKFIWYIYKQCLELQLRKSHIGLGPQRPRSGLGLLVGHNLLQCCAETGNNVLHHPVDDVQWGYLRDKFLTLIPLWLNFATSCIGGLESRCSSSWTSW